MSTEPRSPIGPWLRRLGMLTASPKVSVDEVRAALALYEDMLAGKFPASEFTPQSLEAVAAGSKFFPTYGEVCERLSGFWAKQAAPPKPAIPGAKGGAGYWHGYVASRLVAGADRTHLLSLAKAYASPDELRGILAAFYPAEAQAEADHAAEVRRDKARAVEDVAKAVARSLSARKPAMKSAKPEPEAPPPVDPHAPGRPLTLRELHAKLIRFQREAASPDPPPNAADRIARLQERIAALSGPGGSA
jgi:hypothetical protein